MSFLQRQKHTAGQPLRAQRLINFFLVPIVSLALRAVEVAMSLQPGRMRWRPLSLVVLLAPGACGGGATQIPQPRPVVIYSGARLRADYERMVEVHDWFVREQTNIVEDPSFLVVTEPVADEAYLWDGHRILGDTVWTSVDLRAREAQQVHLTYAHLKLMNKMGRLEEWLPGMSGTLDYPLERAILDRCAEAWLLARTVFGASPYGPLDELVYAREADHLDAFIFTARPSEFAGERAEWARAYPEAMSSYRDWFLETFNREPPGLRVR